MQSQSITELHGVMTHQDSFRHNHYVPEWYQKRFMPSGQSQYHYLDLTPETCVQNGHKYKRRDLQFWGAGKCFAQEDLYTTRWDALENVDIEKYFFGKIDSSGKKAVEYFNNFAHPDVHDTAFHDLMTYMSVQKLRTPKGLRWLREVTCAPDRNTVLITLQGIQNMFCAIWTECVWQIANATNSQTKFIISDQPVTIYNRACFPGSRWCLSCPPSSRPGTGVN